MKNGFIAATFAVLCVSSLIAAPVVTKYNLNVYSRNENYGSVSGGGLYPAGKKVTLKAVAKNGCVFTGWRFDSTGKMVIGDVDFRQTSFSYVTTAENLAIYADFATKESDASSLSFNNNGSISPKVDESFDISLASRITSKSLPVVSLTGLPSGLKFNAKNFHITGKATKPGTYTAKVSLKNTSVKVPIVKDLQFIVPNIKWSDTNTGLTVNNSYTLQAGTLNVFLKGKTWLAKNDYKLSVSGLPSGIKFDAKTGKFSGVATKEGTFLVYFKATKKGAPTEIATSTFKVSFPQLSVESENTDAITATGSGKYPTGKKITIKATAKKGYVFTGWIDADELSELEGDSDWRQPTFAYITGDKSRTIIADYTHVQTDIDSLANNATESISTETDGSLTYDIDPRITSYSFPVVSLSGLPSGLKFDAKKLIITGTATKPGVYTVKVSVKNASVKTAIVKEMTITVPNKQSGLYVGKLDYNSSATKYAFTLSQKQDFTFVEMPANSNVAVSGLPSGMKFDTKTGKISGAPTKAGTYTVTLTTTIGKEKHVDTVTFKINSLDFWAVGTFSFSSVCTATATANGAISGKFLSLEGDKLITIPFSAKNITDSANVDSVTKNSKVCWDLPATKNFNSMSIDVRPYKKDDGSVFGKMVIMVDGMELDAGQHPWSITTPSEFKPQISGTPKTPRFVLAEGFDAEFSLSSKGVMTIKFYEHNYQPWSATCNLIHLAKIDSNTYKYYATFFVPQGSLKNNLIGFEFTVKTNDDNVIDSKKSDWCTLIEDVPGDGCDLGSPIE